MHATKIPLSPPGLDELAAKLKAPLAANYNDSSASVVTCPDLRKAPFHLTTEGLSGNEVASDVGGQPNLYPTANLDAVWSLMDIAKAMDMAPDKGSLIGAGAGPFPTIGANSELCPNCSWQGGFSEDKITNGTRFAQILRDSGAPNIKQSPCLDCALMINLFGSRGDPGPVLKVTARGRKGAEKSFTECIRKALHAAYGDSQIISLGGAFVIASGQTNYHIMPDFPSDLPFRDFAHLNNWLTYHDFDAPIVCMTLLHSADPEKKLGLRLEHSHGFNPDGQDMGGHYHGDLGGDDVEYVGYFNTAKVLYRIEKPAITLEHDLHHE